MSTPAQVLAAAFSSELCERSTREICIPGVSETALEDFLLCLYSGGLADEVGRDSHIAAKKTNCFKRLQEASYSMWRSFLNTVLLAHKEGSRTGAE